MTEQQKPPSQSNPPGQSDENASERAASGEKLETVQHADYPLEHDLKAGDAAARREAEERRARMSGKAPGPVGGQAAGGWERDVLEKVLMASLREQRAARRWKIFFRLVGLAIIGLIVFAVIDFKGDALTSTTGRHTAMVTQIGRAHV